MKHVTSTALLSVWVLVGCCGGSTPPAEAPEESVNEPASSEPPAKSAQSGSVDEWEEPEEEATEAQPEPEPEAPPPEPDFPEDASVQEAMDAVPQGAERINVERELLGKPLTDPDLYEPCNIGSQHFTMKIAVWNGRAVGIDIDTRNQKLAECLKQQIRGIEWPDPVPSLNTVEYAM